MVAVETTTTSLWKAQQRMCSGKRWGKEKSEARVQTHNNNDYDGNKFPQALKRARLWKDLSEDVGWQSGSLELKGTRVGFLHGASYLAL